jgi:uncharacterized protein YecE (DUF72 family)
MLPLFPPELPRRRAALRDRLGALASEGVFIGTSSWKYEGWLGDIYLEERYLARGRFSRRLFEETCLSEYAETFPAVCGDFSFYQFPTPEYWKKLFHLAPARLKFAFKVPEEITVRTWPSHPRYGPRAGLDNPSFLNADAFAALFAEPLAAYRERVAALIFEFKTFPRAAYPDAAAFAAGLDPFLANLPKGFRYATEVRNPEFLAPPYFDTLRRHGAAHVFNAWTRMPELGRQIAMPDAWTADFSVTRALLRHGRVYEQAVEKFQPYASVQEPNPAARAALKQIVNRARDERRTAYIFVNNRLEGNAPGTIAAVLGVED